MKNFIAGLCILSSVFLFVLANGRVFGLVLPVILFCSGFCFSGGLSILLEIINVKFNKSLPPFLMFILANACCFGLAVPVKAHIVNNFPVESIFVPYIDIRSELFHTFNSYKVSDYEAIDGLKERSCEIENRFIYILADINKVDVTNSEIHKRVDNLQDRKKKLLSNQKKINKRAIDANITQLFLDVPNVNVPEINLKKSYQNLLDYNKAIDKNIRKPNCTPECALKHIEQNSWSIVQEIDNIKAKQDSLNATLTAFERSFDELEKLQLMKETELTQRGF